MSKEVHRGPTHDLVEPDVQGDRPLDRLHADFKQSILAVDQGAVRCEDVLLVEFPELFLLSLS